MEKSRRFLERLMSEHTDIPYTHIKHYGIYHVNRHRETLTVNSHTIVREGTRITMLVPLVYHKQNVAYREIVIRE